MEQDNVQILVHVTSPCGFHDDVQYRKQARGLLRFLGHQAEDINSSKSEEDKARPPKSIPAPSPSPPKLKQPTRLPPFQVGPTHIDANQRAAGIATDLLHKTPKASALVQVGRTPAFDSKRAPFLERPRTAPAVIKETPLAAPLPREPAPRFSTPSSTVPDSEPSRGSFKRAFVEVSTVSVSTSAGSAFSLPPRKRARTEPPASSEQTGRLPHTQTPERLSQSMQPLFGLDGAWSRGPGTSSPSPPKRRWPVPRLNSHPSAPAENQKDAEPSPTPPQNTLIHKDADADASSQSVRSSHRNEPNASPLPFSSSQSSANLRPPSPSPPSPRSKRITLSYAQRSSLLRSHPAASLLITAPRPPTSSQSFTTHLTPALAIIRSRLQPLSKYFSPRIQHRRIRPLERGHWRLALPLAWPHAARATFWRRLRNHVLRGKAGFGTRIERVLDGQEVGASQGREECWREKDWGREVWKVWCWGEVVVEVWLLLFVDSGGAVRGVEMSWCDGAEETVVEM